MIMTGPKGWVRVGSFSVVVLAAACGPRVGTGHPCDTGKAQCGMSCTADTDCGTGTYCGTNHACTADCVQGTNDCGDGNECDSHGRCTSSGCVGLRCQVNKACAGGAHTTITGTVFAPNGTLPLYNAQVFVPNQALSPFKEGVECNRCDGSLTGDPIAKALTKPDGTFTLVDVPSGSNIPLVVQLGKWRRQVTLPTVADCQTTAVTDVESTRLPKNASEGDIPKMAIATGSADPLECLFIKLGIDPATITLPSADGRIHFYRGSDKPGLDMTTPAPSATQLYASLDNLLKYDVVLLPCEGDEFDKSRIPGTPFPLPVDPRPLFVQYLDMGGRMFATHYSYDWLTYIGSPYNKVASPSTPPFGTWPTKQVDDYDNTIHTNIVTTFPKGMDFAKWLAAAGATSPPNQLDIIQGRSDLIGVDANYAQAWATYDFTPIGGKPAVMHTTFNTPIDAMKDAMGVGQYCGRVVFSDFHATAGAITAPTDPFPMACKTDPMTDQEKALAFMLFDLSSCVQDDAIPPIL